MGKEDDDLVLKLLRSTQAIVSVWGPPKSIEVLSLRHLACLMSQPTLPLRK